MRSRRSLVTTSRTPQETGIQDFTTSNALARSDAVLLTRARTHEPAYGAAAVRSAPSSSRARSVHPAGDAAPNREPTNENRRQLPRLSVPGSSGHAQAADT